MNHTHVFAVQFKNILAYWKWQKYVSPPRKNGQTITQEEGISQEWFHFIAYKDESKNLY